MNGVIQGSGSCLVKGRSERLTWGLPLSGRGKRGTLNAENDPGPAPPTIRAGNEAMQASFPTRRFPSGAFCAVVTGPGPRLPAVPGHAVDPRRGGNLAIVVTPPPR